MGGPREIGFNRIQYEIDRFRPAFPQPLGEVRELPKRTIRTPVATFEDCRIIAGKTRFDRPSLGQGRWTDESHWEIAVHPEAPFGVVQVHCRSETDEIGGEPTTTMHITAKSTLTLSRVGKGAKSVLPEAGGIQHATEKEKHAAPQVPQEDPVQLERSKMTIVSVKGRITGPSGSPLPNVNVLFSKPNSDFSLRAQTAKDGTYQSEAPSGNATVRVTYREVAANGKAKATILYQADVIVPESGGTMDFQTQRDPPSR